MALFLVSGPSGSSGPATITLEPRVELRGIGLRVGAPPGRKLLDAGVSLQGIAAYCAYARSFVVGAPAAPSLVGGRFDLEGLGVPVGRASGGENRTAAKVLEPGPGGERSDREPLTPAFSPTVSLISRDGRGVEVDLVAGPGEGPWWLPVQRRFGPIYVEQVGIGRRREGRTIRDITVMLDGGVQLAGLAVQVDDLSVTIPRATLHQPETWSLDLAGLAVGAEMGPVQLAGGLRKRRGPPTDYVGALLLRAAGFSVTAFGGFGEYPAGRGETYTSLFVFAALNVPLGGPPPFFVTGLAAGVGLNRRLRLPTDVQRLPEFPLVAALSPESPLARNPMGALEQLGAAFPPERGAFWLAVGVRFSSFSLVDSIAVISVQVGDGVEVALLGLARLGLPNPAAPLAQLELALVARFSSREGVLSIIAQLTDNSWLLHSSCRLTGGFAFVVWFNDGQFVLTLGGYHRNFPKPARFPDVPRLGFNWIMFPVTIKGEAYFALTASCVMAGGRLEVTYGVPLIWASLVASLDALVYFDPFYFSVTVMVRVSAGIDIEVCVPVLGCARVRLGFSISAEVTVEGPEIRGRASLDLGVTTVAVTFGSSAPPNSNHALGFAEFHDKYLVAGDPNGSTMSAAVAAGLAPETGGEGERAADGSAERPWRVLPDFVLVTETRTASKEVVAGGPTPATTVAYGPTPDMARQLDVAPMKRVDLTATHRVTVRRSHDGAVVTDRFGAVPRKGYVPAGTWSFDARRATPPPEAEVRLVHTGVELAASSRPTDPAEAVFVDTHQVESTPQPLPLPFHHEVVQRLDFHAEVQAAGQWAHERPTDTSAILSEAATTLGVTEAEALFVADRVGPPQLAALTEGMVAPVSAGVTGSPVVLPLPSGPPDTTIQPPRLAAVLRLGPASHRTGMAVTTVSDADGLERRLAPSLSVAHVANVNMAAHLSFTSPVPRPAGTTVVATDGGPLTAWAGSRYETRHDYLATAPRRTSLRELEDELSRGVQVPAGDVQVWELSNAAFDGPGSQRPRLEVSGSQLLRTVVLDRAGGVLGEVIASEYELEVPVGTHRIVAVGLGSTAGVAPSGFGGWHAGSRLAQIGPGVLLASGAVVRTSGSSPTRRRQPVAQAVVRAADAVAGFGVVSTRLSAEVSALVLVLETAANADERLEGLLLGLTGAAQAPGPDGRRTAPRVVLSGARAYAVFHVVPDESGRGVTATVASDERWHLAGVFGATSAVDEVAAQLVEKELDDLVQPLHPSPFGLSQLRWRQPEPSPLS